MGTNEEMCVSLFYYYPRMAMKECYSGPVYDNVPVPYSHVQDYFRKYNWKNHIKRQEFIRIVQTSKHAIRCGGGVRIGVSA